MVFTRVSDRLFTDGFLLWLSKNYPIVSIRLDALRIEENNLEYWCDAYSKSATVFEEARDNECECLFQLKVVERQMTSIHNNFIQKYVRWINWQFISASY